MSATGESERRRCGTRTTLIPTRSASPAMEPSRPAVEPATRAQSNSGTPRAVRMVTWRDGPPMFIRVMTRASLGGPVVFKRPLESGLEADFGSITDLRRRERDVRTRMPDVPFPWRPECGEKRPSVEVRDGLDQIEQRVALAASDVHGDAIRLTLRGPNVCLHHAVYMGEVAALHTVAVNRSGTASEGLLDEQWDHCRIWGVRVLAGAEHVEVAQRDYAQPVVLSRMGERDLLA